MPYIQEDILVICRREQERFADEPIEVSCNPKENTIHYKDRENNIMTVKLCPKLGEDYFFYLQYDAPKGSHFGDQVAVINTDTQNYVDDKRFFPKMSDGFQAIVDSWYMDRDEIGVEKSNKTPPVKKFDIDYYTMNMTPETKKTYDIWKPHYEYKSKAKSLREILDQKTETKKLFKFF